MSSISPSGEPASDVIEREAAQTFLREPEEPYRILFQTHPHPMWVYDLETLRFLDVNDATVQDYGYSREEFLAMTLKDIHPAEEVSDVVQLPAVVRHRTCRHVTRSGKVIEVEVASNMLLFGGRRARIVVAHDVTQRRHAEEQRKTAENALRAANEMLQAVIQASPLAIVAMDFDGRVKSWNRAAEQIFGWSETEVLNQLFPIVPEDDMVFFRTNVARARTGGTVAGIERKRRRRDGMLIDVTLWNAVQRDGSGAPIGVISVIADITERKKLEAELQQSQKMEAVGRLAGGVAHDFNNLMTVVTGFGRLILDSLPPEHSLCEQIEEIVKAGDRAASLTNQLLAFGRRQMIYPRVLDLNRVVSEMERMLRRVIIENVDLVIRLEPELGPIMADRVQIEQILMNLVVNARDALPKGGTITVETANAELKGQPHVVLEVTDNGKGMDDETKSRLFEPFFTTKGLGRGTGLGLSTVYGIVKQNGGDVLVNSELGRGTTFKICLPRAESLRETGDSGTACRQAHRLGTETILLVEDEPGVRHLTREMLKKVGYTVVEASSGVEALAMYDALHGSVDLLVTDVVMPQMSGLTLFERLSKVQPRLKVLYLSGYAEQVIAEQGVPETGVTLLAKPFTPEALAHKVREVLDSRK